MERVRYVGWATNSRATVKIRLYVFKKKKKKRGRHNEKSYHKLENQRERDSCGIPQHEIFMQISCWDSYRIMTWLYPWPWIRSVEKLEELLVLYRRTQIGSLAGHKCLDSRVTYDHVSCQRGWNALVYSRVCVREHVDLQRWLTGDNPDDSLAASSSILIIPGYMHAVGHYN
jgi:hypothetical protein